MYKGRHNGCCLTYIGNTSNQDMAAITFEYFEMKDKIGLSSWLKPSKDRTLSHLKHLKIGL